MSANATGWQLGRITINDLLGFQGEKDFSLQPGLQVVQAPNHTGKTSITMALLWGLTGTIPNLARINRQSFRLTNKHAGENAKPAVRIELSCQPGRRMVIQRAYRPRPDLDADLSVEIDEKAYSGEEAQEMMFSELGAQAGSLQGCGVVLQDHRLGLITGKDSDVSDVINDMLGLYTLSQLVPTLEDASKQASDLKKEIQQYQEAADPVAKWEERDRQLRDDFQQLENKAIDAEFSREALDDPRATALEELTSVAQKLGTPPPASDAEPSVEIERLRKALGATRKSAPVSAELAQLQLRNNELSQWSNTALTFSEQFAEHSKKLVEESARGEMDQTKLTDAIANAEAALEQNKSTRKKLEEEQGFLTTAYDHLLAHQDLEKCPICQKAFVPKKLLPELKDRLVGRIADELARLRRQDEAETEKKSAAEKRLKVIKRLRDQHLEQLQAVHLFKERIAASAFAWDSSIEADKLFLDAGARQQLLVRLATTVQKIDVELTSIGIQLEEKKSAHTKQEVELFQPAENRINGVRDHLVPIIAAAEKIERHGKLRQEAEECRAGLKELFEQASDLSTQVKRIGNALSRHEENAASAAVKAQLPRISEFFRKIADNPDYDGLDIQTTLSREQVTYKIMAISSALGNLNDAVGHVLSEGDLSAAGIALLLGLAAGKSQHLGFVVLDDPAQGMDETLQSNLARGLAGLSDHRQIIVFTHQSSFAEALKEAGAAYSRMGGWKLGRHHNA